ncbi:hypothetical protein DVH02_05065 [Streptomyces corynorhini]|uniref:ARB-07466-like C-terminal domain-containing protein n=1 Tax=Streptomyces corynorhini TaxID=2282652 RepID=A0A370BFU8_9ACTN|nr:hypothetical protein DVH02_05065 [Streptomyces corynorhini]
MAAFTVLVALAGYVYAQYTSSRDSSPRCVVRAAGGQDEDAPSYTMTPDQAMNAATISAVGTSRGLPERAVTIALATALQESALRNLDYGDRDSLGLFQQRPSKGWGTEAQIQDPVYSAGEFYDHLVKVPGYSRLPLTEAAQRVQRSGFPQAYAKHEPDAALLASALTGRSAAALTCSAPSSGVSGDPAKVRAGLVRAFGADVLPAGRSAGRSAPGAGDTGDAGRELSVPVTATAGSAGRRGKSVDTSARSRHGWELAHWAVAQSTALGIDEVSFAGRVWSAKDAAKGWRTVDGSAATGTDDVRIHTAR